jgi:hypothetical protein
MVKDAGVAILKHFEEGNLLFYAESLAGAHIKKSRSGWSRTIDSKLLFIQQFPFGALVRYGSD